MSATLEQIAAPTETRVPAVGREFYGRARDMLVDLIQRWRFMPCRNWRLSITARLDKARASMIEHRLVAGYLRHPDDPNWVGMEDDVAVIRVELDVNRSRAHLESKCVAAISLHALARRLQRHPDGATEALMHGHINLIAEATSGELVAGAGYRVRTHEDGGGWRGRVIKQIGTGRGGASRALDQDVARIVMESDALRLAKANAVIGAERALRSKAEYELRAAQLEVRRLRKALSILHARLNAKEPADAAA